MFLMDQYCRRAGESPLAQSQTRLAVPAGLPFASFSCRYMSIAPPLPSSPAADRAMIEAVARGDQAAFARLYDRLSGPLYSLCLRMLGTEAEARDALQEAFLVIWRRASSYDPAQGAMFTWAVHLTRCKVIDHLRSRDRRLRIVAPVEPVEPDEFEAEGLAARVADDSTDAAAQTDRNERAGAVRRILADLPAEQSQVIELAFFSDLTHFEISARLGQPLGTVKARIRRALLKLRERLSKVS